MAWVECKKCKRKIVQLGNRPATHDGWCGVCYEEVTGKCADCEGAGHINRAHLGVVECPRCEGTGKAKTTFV